MKLLSILAAQSQQRLRRLLICACLAIASIISGAIGLGFATFALFAQWRLQYGAINAAVGLAAIYLVLAGVLYLCCRRAGLSPHAASGPTARSPGDAVDALKAAAQASGAPQAAAVAMGVEIARQMTPLQLALLAALSGFVAGRRL